MIDQKIGKHCTGCTACANSCPVSAIIMKPDSEGFLQPKVNHENCIRCGLCESVCSIATPQKSKCRDPEVYASWNLNEEIRKQSTSGGVFTALAQAFIEHGGYVAGAIYDSNFTIKHILTNTPEEITLLRQSKYAQSLLGNLFSQIEERLKNGKMVLFCGTPCQTSGLQRFLKKDYSTLYCCDFICRGVISPDVYRKFLEDSNKRHSAPLACVHFKNKEFGWNRFSTKLSYTDGSSYHLDRNTDYYMRGFLRHNLYIRPSCHVCAFKSIPRYADISLGDFWGIGKYKECLDNDMGTSAVLVSSEKGKQLISWSEDKLYLEKRTLDEVTTGNSCLLNSAGEGEFREYFFKRFRNQDFFKLVDRIDRMSLHLTPKDYILRNLSVIKHKLLGR